MKKKKLQKLSFSGCVVMWPVEALLKKNTGFCTVSGFAGRRNFPFSRAVSEPNRDKMALYNFKKIMVVPTAKVRFFRRIDVWDLTIFYPVCLSGFRKEDI